MSSSESGSFNAHIIVTRELEAKKPSFWNQLSKGLGKAVTTAAPIARQSLPLPKPLPFTPPVSVPPICIWDLSIRIIMVNQRAFAHLGLLPSAPCQMTNRAGLAKTYWRK